VHDVLIDARTWEIRYLLVAVTDPDGEREVACPPELITRMDLSKHRIVVGALPSSDAEGASDDTLRSCRHVLGSPVSGWTGDIGSAADVVFETDSWMLRFLLVDASSWFSGGLVFVRPELIDESRWEGRAIPVAITHTEVIGAPVETQAALGGGFDSAAEPSLH
jgi:hypothetical protein